MHRDDPTAPAPTPDRTPSVTVVIPVKDDSDELERCLAALERQTRRPDEIVVVDNDSADASAEVARRAGAVVVHCPTPGIPAASAAGYDRASGDLILRLDADCRPAGTWVQECVAALDERNDMVACSGGARFVDGPWLLRRLLAAAYLGAYAAATIPALGHRPLFGSNLAMRRETWQRISAHVHRGDAELHDDLDLAYHLGLHGRIGSVPARTMGISMRPFASAHGFARRTRRGVRTVVRHWPMHFPPVRWVRLAVGRSIRVRPRLAGRGRAVAR